MKGMIHIGDLETSYTVDKYRRPKLLTKNDSIVQTLMNALFMKPGNLPGLPNVGCDIEQYLYKTTTDLDSNKLISDLEYSCGKIISGITVTDIAFNVVTFKGEAVFVLSVKISSDDSDQILAIGIKRDNDIIRYNPEFIDIGGI